jgi:hypothetical protein
MGRFSALFVEFFRALGGNSAKVRGQSLAKQHQTHGR